MLLTITAGLNLTAFADTPTSGQCGENAYYSYDSTTKVLTISGSGELSGAKKIYYVDDPYEYYWISLFINFDFEKVVFEGNITSVGYKSFYNCKSLVEAIIPDTVTSIESEAFRECTSLKKINLPTGIKTIGSNVFDSCCNLESLDIPKSVSSIGYNATPTSYYASSSDDVILKDLTIIKNYKGSESEWASISFGSNDYGDYSQNGANLYINNAPLKDVNISNLDKINSGAFKGCKSIISVTTDLSLKEVGEEAFANCANLTTITIPSNVKLYTESGYQNSLYQNSFPSSSIKVINILPGSTEISNSFSTLVRSSSVTEMEIPNSITYIPDSAFKDMTSLTSITIPKSVTRIEYNAFSGCTNLTIKGYKNSYAENYATMLGIPFEALDGGSEEHTHNYSTKTTATTTSENGSIVVSCDICGDELYKQIIYRPTKYKLSATSYTYDGKAKKPSVTVTDSNGDVISANNYTVTYSNNKSVGKATVKITFKGNYSGTVNKTFTINPKPTKITSLKAKSKGFKLKWSKVTAQADGYQIQYSTSRNFKSVKTVTVKGHKNITKTISKLKGKKKYYVRVRCYKKVGNVNYYSTWCKAKVVKTNK